MRKGTTNHHEQGSAKAKWSSREDAFGVNLCSQFFWCMKRVKVKTVYVMRCGGKTTPIASIAKQCQINEGVQTQGCLNGFNLRD